MTTKVAVVILNYNGKRYLKQFLPNVITYSAGCKIVVADNASSDDSVEYIQTNHPEVEVIIIPENQGFSKGYNTALRQITSDYYILLNSDVEVTPRWTEPLVELLKNDVSAAACQPKILSFDKRNYFEYAGAAGGFIDTLGYPFCRGRIFDELEEDYGQYDDQAYICWATGACLCIRAEVFHKIGGFDEDFFAHMEEIDLCWRLYNAGYNIGYTSKSKVFHIGGGTLNKLNPYKTYLNFRNGIWMLIKNEKKLNLFYKLPLRLFLDQVAAFNYLLRKPSAFLAIEKAHLHFFKHFKKMYDKRDGLNNFEKTDKTHLKNVRYNGLIILDYFLKRRIKYSDLKD